MTNRPFPSLKVLCIAIALAMSSTQAFSQVAAAEPSAVEILAAANVAMSQPLKYRLITSGVETVVYQKKLPDGSMAALSDMSSPVKMISITYGDKSYELYLEHGVAIDTQMKYHAAKGQAASVLSSLGVKAAGSSKLIGTVQRDGKKCYEIESTLATGVVEALAKGTPPGIQNMVPAKFRYVIEKNSNLMVELETISQKGSSLSKAEWKDITPQPDLSDEFFMLPPGLEVKKPASLREYMSLVVAMLRKNIPELTLQPLPPLPRQSHLN